MSITIAGKTGHIAEIDKMGRTLSLSETVSYLERKSVDGILWNLSLRGIITTAAADVMYFLNTGSDDLNIADIILRSSTNCDFELFKVTGVPAGTTPLVGINRYLGKTTPLTATASFGTNITGLARESNPFYSIPAGANSTVQLKIDSHFQIPPGSAICIRASVATTFTASITVYRDQND